MRKYILIQHNRGNHSPTQVYFHGRNIFEGTKTECNKELVRMRKFCKEKYHNTSTNDTLKDFINYEMSDIFFIKKNDIQIQWA